jgi:hypothetical protein
MDHRKGASEGRTVDTGSAIVPWLSQGLDLLQHLFHGSFGSIDQYIARIFGLTGSFDRSVSRIQTDNLQSLLISQHTAFPASSPVPRSEHPAMEVECML